MHLALDRFALFMYNMFANGETQDVKEIWSTRDEVIDLDGSTSVICDGVKYIKGVYIDLVMDV